MPSKSTLDPDNVPKGSARRAAPKARSTRTLGPSDSSDSGSDLAGALPNADDLSLDRGADEDALGGTARDIDTDRIVGADEAGLGSGLDQAEEAQLGVQDDQTAASEHERRRRIAEAAYYRAEQRGFAPGGEESDWIEAEKEIDGGR
jgi:hypothetical protein